MDNTRLDSGRILALNARSRHVDGRRSVGGTRVQVRIKAVVVRGDLDRTSGALTNVGCFYFEPQVLYDFLLDSTGFCTFFARPKGLAQKVI